MRNNLGYFIFNKSSDFERGCLNNLIYIGSGIVVDSPLQEKGSFLSRVLDSYQTDMNWHRLSFQITGSLESAYKLTVYSSNSLNFEREGGIYQIDELIRSTEYSINQKLDLLEPFIQKQVIGLKDILLHEILGRYLWILLEIFPQGNNQTVFSNIMIYLPSRSWLEYLPAIYQKSDLESGFLDRYLGVFQTLYEDLNLRIGKVANFFDVDFADGEFLQWLSEWLDIADSYIWPEEKLKRLLSRSMELYRERGTKKSIEDIVEIYTGAKPYVIETFQLENFKGSEECNKTLLSLYGNNPLGFTVLVRDEFVTTPREYNILFKLIEEMMPVQMELKLVVIKSYIFLNQYSYLGINSVLGQYRNVSLDGSVLLPLAVINN